MLIYLLLSCCLISTFFFAVCWLFGINPSEKWIRQWTTIFSLLLIFTHGLLLLQYFQKGPIEVNFKNLVSILDYSLDLSFKVDGLGLLFGTMTSILMAVVSRYSFEYLSREPGFFRFFSLVSSLGSALIFIFYSSNYDGLALGWELVGICSVLLIGFFHRHERGARSSLYALISYKFGDTALLAAIGLMHHHSDSTTFSTVHLMEHSSLLVPALLIFACLPKSSQFPFSGWIKRAIEGPSASTAIFYGALSIHLGPFLLLRSSPLWEQSLILRAMIILCGALTMSIATAQARTRSDAKSVLVAASQAQVGLIFIEITLGLKTLALLHIVGHAGLRTWQLLRASSLLQDFQDNPTIFEMLSHHTKTKMNKKLYHFFLNGFYIESLLEALIVHPLQKLGNLKDSRQRAMLLAVANIVFTFFISKLAPTWIATGLIIVLWQSLRALCTTSIPHSFFLVSLSQFLQIWVGTVCTSAPISLVIFAFVCEIPLILALWYWIHRLDQQIDLERKESFFGLNSLNPDLFSIFTILTLLMSGIPFGITFFSDDLIFHELLNQSLFATLLLILSFGLNTGALLRLTYRLFWGLPREGEKLKNLSIIEKWGVRIVVIAYGLGGIFPTYLFKLIQTNFH